MNQKGSNSFVLIVVFLAFLVASGLAYHYKSQRDAYYNQLNGLTGSKAHADL